jgi:voltage-gated potassium channel
MIKRDRQSPLSEIYTALLLVFITLSIGVTGYMAIERYSFVEALYMTVITLATVGFQEVNPLSEPGRIFTTVLILFNLGIFAFVITRISRYFLDGEFARYYKIYRMRSKIDKLQGHTIVCGFGRNGEEAIRVLGKNREDFVVIERSERVLESKKTDSLLFINGDATKDNVLEEAGIDRAGALISALPEDTLNVFVVLTARSLNPRIKLISRASETTSVRKLKSAGADNVIMPDKIGGTHMAMLVNNPDIEEFVDIMSTQTGDLFQINELPVNRVVNIGNLNSWQQFGATLLGYKDNEGEYQLNPGPDTNLSPGYRVIAMGSREQIDKLKKAID